jgi:hypothetical protein
METPNGSRAWLLVFLLAGCAAPPAQVAEPAPTWVDRCQDPAVQDLVIAVLVIDLACDSVSPQTRPERERIVGPLIAEYRSCFAHFQQLNSEIRSEAAVAADAIRRATQPPESTTCTDFAARVARLRKLTGR